VARFHDTIKQTKKDLIIRAVGEADGNYNAAARLLGLHPNYLHRLIKNFQLKRPSRIRPRTDRSGVGYYHALLVFTGRHR
jgi:DNA-binding NtrC family response regulator